MPLRRVARLLLIAGTLLITEAVPTPGLAEPAQTRTKNVLFISGERSDMPAMRELEETMRAVFHQSRGPEVDFFPEYLDFARFPVEQYADSDVRYLRARYGGQHVDLVMVTTGFALEFILSHRDELFPGVPIVFCAAADREIRLPQLPPDVTGVTGHFDLERTLKLIFALQPNVTQIVCVGGTSEFDRFWEDETRKVLEQFPDRTEFRWITDLSLSQTANELSKLPSSAAVFYISMLRDAAGHTMTATDAVRDLCLASNAPVYGITAHFLDAGTVGGAVFDFGRNGQKAAELVLKVLRGEWVPVGSPELEIRNPLVVNWVALHKWKLSESRVPGEAEIRHMSPSLWDAHRTLILWTIFVVLVQSALIVGWVVQRLWRRRAESSLLESERRFRTMADAAPVLIWMSAADKSVTFVNKAWLQFTGRSMERELGHGLVDIVHPEDVDRTRSAYSVAFEARKPFTANYRLRRYDGVYRFFTDSGVPRYGSRGDFRGYIGVCVDITDMIKQQKALHEFEERVTLAADAAQLGVWELNTETRELWVSDKTRELFQFPASGPVRYSDFSDRIHPEDRAMRDAAFKRAVETHSGYEIEYRACFPDGTVRWMHGRCQCVGDEEGRFTRLLGVSMDVTERKVAEAKAREAREEIDRLTRISLLGETTASIAHELNQPLSAIASNANAAKRFLDQNKLDSKTIREILEDVGSDARRAYDIIQGIRNTIKKGAAIRERINLNEVVNHVAHSIRPDAAIYSCEIDTALDQSLPEVEGDPVQLQQVLINLVTNAFDAMSTTPPQRRKVRIRTERKDRTVALTVRDHGIGIQEDAREKLFDQFFTTKRDGLGLGLAIVRSIIETHGGRITAENAAGGGARFRFILPMATGQPTPKAGNGHLS